MTRLQPMFSRTVERTRSKRSAGIPFASTASSGGVCTHSQLGSALELNKTAPGSTRQTARVSQGWWFVWVRAAYNRAALTDIILIAGPPHLEAKRSVLRSFRARRVAKPLVEAIVLHRQPAQQPINHLRLGTTRRSVMEVPAP